jgi:hypothetical protein
LQPYVSVRATKNLMKVAHSLAPVNMSKVSIYLLTMDGKVFDYFPNEVKDRLQPCAIKFYDIEITISPVEQFNLRWLRLKTRCALANSGPLSSCVAYSGKAYDQIVGQWRQRPRTRIAYRVAPARGRRDAVPSASVEGIDMNCQRNHNGGRH